VLFTNPIGDRHEAPGEKTDIETQRGSMVVDQFFVLRQQVNEDRGDRASIQDVSNPAISRAMPAAAASVRKDHQAGSGRR
jgi:hypothetical protein